MKIFAFISILLLPVITQAEMPITRGSMLALSCTGCHGTNGKSPGAIPTIAGKSAGYLITIMKDFRDNRIFSTVMGRQAKGYTDEEITLIAEYLTTYK